MFVFFIQLWNFKKISIFLASAGSFNVKNDNFTLFFAVEVANFEFAGFAWKQKYTVCSVSMEIASNAKSWRRKNQSEQRDLLRTGFAIIIISLTDRLSKDDEEDDGDNNNDN